MNAPNRKRAVFNLDQEKKNRISPLFVESSDFLGGGEGEGFPDFPLSGLAGLRAIATLNNYNL